ncbi:Sortase family protein [compost metagenome]
MVYEAAGIDLPVEAINQPGLYFDPPLVKTASYWLDQFGQPGERSTNTTYIVAHSGETGGWPFNQLSLSTKIGDVIEVYTDNGVVRFGVTSIKSYEKRLLEDNTATPVSDIDGRRLVLISCKSGDVWQQNIVVMATML